MTPVDLRLVAHLDIQINGEPLASFYGSVSELLAGDIDKAYQVPNNAMALQAHMAAMSSMGDESEDNFRRPPGEVADRELNEMMRGLRFERSRRLCARYGG